MKKTIINAKNAPAAVGPYVHAVKAGNFVFTPVSGMRPICPDVNTKFPAFTACT